MAVNFWANLDQSWLPKYSKLLAVFFKFYVII